MSAPNRLYKYQPLTTHTLANLKGRRIWFSAPAQFNDPFDCGISVVQPDLSDIDFQRLFDRYRSQQDDPTSWETRYLEGGRVTHRFKEEVRRGIGAAFEERRRIQFEQRGVSCLCENKDDLLMWAHYADGHKGFCLEFDGSQEPFSKARKVSYADSVPLVNPMKLLLDPEHFAPLEAMMLVKSTHWAYEQEWRLLHIEPNRPYTYPWQALTGVYIGAAMAYEQMEVIALILEGSPTKLYQMRTAQTGFFLEAHEFTYTPFKYE